MNFLGKIPLQTYPEEFVVSELFKSSKQFQEFYKNERSKIINQIIWAHDETLPLGIDFRVTRHRSGKQYIRVIRIRIVPVSIDDAYKIAHELTHLICDAEGFPSVGSTPKYESIIGALNSMVHDLNVNEILVRYGFDLIHEYESEIADDVRRLERFSTAPSDQLDRLLWIFNYVSTILDWEFINHSNKKSEFQVWFDQKFPEIAKEGKNLLVLVKRMGYDTPQKQFRLFQEINRQYKLNLPIAYLN